MTTRHLLRRLRWPLVGAAAAALALTTAAALAGSGIGGVFNLGVSNTVDAQSVLTGNSGATPQLRVQNNGTGPALSLVSGSATSPLIKLSNSAKIKSLNADLFDGIDSSSFLRLRTDPAATTISSPGNAQISGTSATIGVDGLPVVSYFDGSDFTLKVAHCSNLACSSSSTPTIDTDNVGRFSSIAIGSDGFPLNSYNDANNGALKVAHCSTVTCSTSTAATIDDPGTDAVGTFTSLAIGTDGKGLISYYDITNGNLKVAHCANTACSSADAITPLDSAGDVGKNSSITIGADGHGLISYYDETNGNLNVAHCGNANCTSADSIGGRVVTDDVGRNSSITIGADGLGLIAYEDTTNGHINISHCGDLQCSWVHNPAPVMDPFVPIQPSLTIGPDGLGVISYRDSAGDLKIAHCGDVACSSAQAFGPVDTASGDPQNSSLTIGADGLPFMSYIDVVALTLKVAHCGSPFCTSYWRRR